MTIKRLSHAVYDTRYHLVWAPKYRKWILKEKLRDTVKELFEEILKARGIWGGEFGKMDILSEPLETKSLVKR